MKTDKDIPDMAVQITQCSKNASSALQDQDFEEAKREFEEAFKISKQIRDPFTQRKCAFNLGAVYVRLSQATKGLEFLELAAPPENRIDTVTNNGDLYFNMGLAYEMLKDFEIAVSYFKKALKEYKQFQEQVNDKMIVETLEKLARNCRYLKKYLESAEWNEELCEIYILKGHEDKRFVTMGEQVVQLRKANENVKSMNVADQILNQLDRIMITPFTANMLNDVGLVLSQYERFDEAERCHVKALSMASVLPTCDKLAAVLLQNLGALYNLTAAYQKSIDYHSKAADKFGELNNPVNEGHCYANLGYAYNQVGDMDKARDNFLLALRKAKDNGDPHSEWQVLESLGALCCNLGNLDVAIKYYTDAFKTIAKDVNSNTASAEDRIQTKLFTVMKQQAEKQQTNSQQIIVTDKQEQNVLSKQQIEISELKQNVTNLQQQQHQQQPPQNVINTKQPIKDQQPSIIVKKPSIMMERSNQPDLSGPPATFPVTLSAPELDNLPNRLSNTETKTRKELIKRRLKVRRSGSLREFDKVARGVYVSMHSDVLDSLQEEPRSIHSSDYSFTDADTSSLSESTSNSSSSLSSDDSHKQSRKNILKLIKEKAEQKLKDWINDSPTSSVRGQMSFAKRHSEDKGNPLNISLLQMDEDQQQVKELMRKQLEQDSDNESDQLPGNQKSGKKKQIKKSSSSSLLSSSSSSDTDVTVSSLSDESESETEMDEGSSHTQKKSGPPTLPTSTPPQTLINTYETPQKEEPHYTEIDFENSSKVKLGENNKQSLEPHNGRTEGDHFIESYYAKIDIESRKNKNFEQTAEPDYAEINFKRKTIEGCYQMNSENGGKRNSIDLGPNYFYDGNVQMALNSNQGLHSTSFSDTVYETIRSASDTIDKYPEGPEITNSPAKSDLLQLSRAEREQYLFEQHRKSQHVEITEQQKPNKIKPSKVCNVM